MGNKGNRRHLKSLNAPEYFFIHRKENKYVTKQNPGRHTKTKSISLILAVKKAGFASSTSEARRIIVQGEIKLNNRIIREPKYPIGMSDVLEAPSSSKAFKITTDHKGHLVMDQILEPKNEKTQYKVIGKYRAKHGDLMIRLHDGSIAHAPKDIKVNDSVALDSDRKVKSSMVIGIGAKCMIIDGVHIGSSGKIKDIKKGTFSTRASVVIESDKEEFETLVKNVMVIG